MKQTVAVRRDLNMSTGKVAAQVAHASLWAYQKTDGLSRELWEDNDERVVVVGIDSQEKMENMADDAQDRDVVFAIVNDKGFTEVDKYASTAIAFGPDTDSIIDEITGDLPLY